MKKLLILAYDFPPYVSVGALRPYSWYKYLKKYDVYPVVATRQWDNKYGNGLDYIAPGKSAQTIIEDTEFGTVIQTPYKPNLANKIMLKYGNNKFSLLRKIISAWYEFMQFLFFIGPKSGLYYGADEYLKNNKADAIIATGEPFILFKYADKLSRKYNIPWIADYRDPWLETTSRTKYMDKWNAYFERQFVRNERCITTVSNFLKKKIEQNLQNKVIKIITNGYDSDLTNKVAQIKQNSDCLRFAFVGTIYKWHPILSVLNVFSKFSENRNFELNFYGVNNRTETDIKNSFPNLSSHINIYPKLSNADMLKTIATHNVLLLFNDYSIMGTKIYDYLGIKRKILLCYSDDKEAKILKEKYYPTNEIEGLSTHLQEDTIIETNSGIIAKDAQNLASILESLYSEFEQNKFIACDSVNTEQFSREYQAQKLAEIVKEEM